MSSIKPISQETFRGLAFPVARTRYAGPTNTRGSRYVASIRRDNERTYRATVHYDAALSPSENALAAALKCFQAALIGNYHDYQSVELEPPSARDYVAVPGDLDANGYSFTFVPLYIFNREA
jgi:hypothetical protein